MLTGLVAAFLLFDAIGKLLMLAPVVEGTRQVGYAVGVIRPLGLLLALSTLLHLIPRTQLVGALLLTAYLGGATATHVRLGQPFWFPVAMGAIIWIAYVSAQPEPARAPSSTPIPLESREETTMRFMIMHKNDPHTEAGEPPPKELVEKMGEFIGGHAQGRPPHRRRGPGRQARRAPASPSATGRAR